MLLLTLLTFSLIILLSLSLKNKVNYGSIKPPIDIITNKPGGPGGEYGIRQLDRQGNSI